MEIMEIVRELRNQGYDKEEALELYRQMKKDAEFLLKNNGDLNDLEEILYEHGLEPDYVMELL